MITLASGMIHSLLQSAGSDAGSSWSDPSTIVALAGALGVGGVLTAILTLGPTRRKIRMEAESSGGNTTSVLTSSAISLLEPMRNRINDLVSEVKVKELHIELLEAQVKTYGGVPVNEPVVHATDSE